MSPLEIEQLLGHIEMGVFDERLDDVRSAVSLRQFALNQEAAERKEQERLAEVAQEIDALVRDVLILYSQDKTNVKTISSAIMLFKEARKVGRQDLATKIAQDVFNLSEGQIK